MDKDSAAAIYGASDKATSFRKMDENVLVFEVLDGYRQVVGSLQGIIRTCRNNMRDAKMSAKLDGLCSGKTVVEV